MLRFTYSGDAVNTVAISGSGISTVLTDTAASTASVLLLAGAGSSVSSFKIVVPSIPSPAESDGLSLAGGSASDLTIVGTSTTNKYQSGIATNGTSATVDHSSISMASNTPAGCCSYGIYGVSTNLTVRDTTISELSTNGGGIGFGEAGQLLVQRSTIQASSLGIYRYGAAAATTLIEDSVVRQVAGTASGTGLTMAANASISNDTIIGFPTGLFAFSASTGAYYDTAVAVDSSIISGATTALKSQHQPGYSTVISARNSDFDPATDNTSGGGTIDLGGSAGGNINADPLFVSALDAHLVSASPAIDTGLAGPLAAAQSPTDLDGNARVQDAHSTGTARRDMGAYEFPGNPPPVVVTPTPQPILKGLPPIVVCHLPNVVGRSLASAKKQIKAAGCAVGKVKTAKHSKHQKLVVIKELPKGSTTQPIGKKIALTVGPKPKKKAHKH